MVQNPYDLPTDRLATTDEEGHRVYLYPEDVKGPWKFKRHVIYTLLIFIFMILPWIHYKGKQIILLNIPGREFTFFGETFLGHDAPFVIFFLLGFVLAMGLVTSLWGRVWCGWACPQTVFIQAVYGRIERLVEGPARRRQKRDAGAWGVEKLGLKSLKWLLFTLVSLHLSHSVLGYFVGTHELLKISTQSPMDNWTLFIIMLFFTALFNFDFGWFREQFCIIACPYGRFQSVMMDESSLVVAYDDKRGEPRRAKEVPKDQEGDCVNCYHCVRVCPTGIDIRRGAGQLECIACTQCIDACDEIMLKVGKPKGLIKYTSENKIRGLTQSWIRPRVIIYAVLLTGVLGAFLFSIQKRQEMGLTFIRGAGEPYSLIDEGMTVLNRFSLKIDNAEKVDIPVVFELPEEFKERVQFVIPRTPYLAKPGHNSVGVFFRYEKTLLDQGSLKLQIDAYKEVQGEEPVFLKSIEVNLVGPL
jgi:cytochrome c oxidase accessory protein FixG